MGRKRGFYFDGILSSLTLMSIVLKLASLPFPGIFAGYFSVAYLLSNQLAGSYLCIIGRDLTLTTPHTL